MRDRLITMTDLGLDCQMPWNEKFHIKPEAFTAEGWLPEAPSSYDEALTRQQRLLHGNERRQSLRLHKVTDATMGWLHALAAWTDRCRPPYSTR